MTCRKGYWDEEVDGTQDWDQRRSAYGTNLRMRNYAPFLVLGLLALGFLLWFVMKKKEKSPVAVPKEKASTPPASASKLSKVGNQEVTAPNTGNFAVHEIVSVPTPEASKDIHQVANTILKRARVPLSQKQKSLLTDPRILTQWKLVSEEPLVFFYSGEHHDDLWQIYYEPTKKAYKFIHLDPTIGSSMACTPDSPDYPNCWFGSLANTNMTSVIQPRDNWWKYRSDFALQTKWPSNTDHWNVLTTPIGSTRQPS